MRYFTKLQGQKEAVPVDIEPLGDNRYKLTLQGATHIVDALTLPHGAVTMLVDGHSYGVEFDESGEEVGVLVRGQVTRVDVADERRLRLRAGTAGFSAEGKQVINAPMPGKVVKVLVKLGDEVAAGQGVAVIEAMKMENEMRAGRAGKIAAIHVAEGQTLEAQAQVLTIE